MASPLDGAALSTAFSNAPRPAGFYGAALARGRGYVRFDAVVLYKINECFRASLGGRNPTDARYIENTSSNIESFDRPLASLIASLTASEA